MKKDSSIQKLKANVSERTSRIVEYINALSTVIIAAFTVVLAFVGFLQLRVMRSGDAQNVQLNRAFVYLSSPSPFEIVFIEPDLSVQIQPTWENSGNTPSKGLAMHTNIMQATSPIPADFDFPDYDSTGKKSDTSAIYGLIAPKGKLPGMGVHITPELRKKINDGKSYVYLYGWARYQDILDSEVWHITKFCDQLINITIDDSTSPVRHTIITQPCSNGNCSDGECQKGKLSRN